jgi:hypothetical protein
VGSCALQAKDAGGGDGSHNSSTAEHLTLSGVFVIHSKLAASAGDVLRRRVAPGRKGLLLVHLPLWAGPKPPVF